MLNKLRQVDDQNVPRISGKPDFSQIALISAFVISLLAGCGKSGGCTPEEGGNVFGNNGNVPAKIVESTSASGGEPLEDDLEDSEIEQFANVEEQSDAYLGGMRLVTEKLNASSIMPNDLIVSLIKFVNVACVVGEFLPNGELKHWRVPSTVLNGEIRGSIPLIMFLPPGHKNVTYDSPLAWVNGNLLTIQPDKITTKWAALLLSHEIIHLMAGFQKTDHGKVTREEYLLEEFDAYTLELDVADLLTDGLYTDKTVEIVKRESIDVKKLKAMFTSEVKGLGDLLDELNKVVTDEDPLSKQEDGIRGGLAAVSLIYVAVDGEDISDEAKHKLAVKLLGLLMEASDDKDRLPAE